MASLSLVCHSASAIADSKCVEWCIAIMMPLVPYRRMSKRPVGIAVVLHKKDKKPKVRMELNT